MNTFDFSPFFRSTVGFDRVFDLLDEATRSDDVAWPPYNIEKLGEDSYRITMAVAGFSQEDLSVVAHENTLIVTGKLKNGDTKATQYLYRGIAGRGFERRFNMADHVKVAGASLVNGLLHIELKREVPEAMKPRTIAIQSGSVPKAIEARAA